MMEKMNYWIVPTFAFIDLSKEQKENNLISKVCDMCNVTLEDLKSKTRLRGVVEARFIIFYMLHKICRYNQKETGKMFNRDHATVIHGCKTIIDLMSWDKQFEDKIERLIDYTRYSFKIETIDIKTGAKRSKYIGVSWSKSEKKWRAQIYFDGKQNHIGWFKNEYEAHLSYQRKKSLTT